MRITKGDGFDRIEDYVTFVEFGDRVERLNNINRWTFTLDNQPQAYRVDPYPGAIDASFVPDTRPQDDEQ